MMVARRYGRLAGPVILILATACGGAQPRSSGTTPARISADSAARLEARYRAQTDTLRGRFTEADAAFMAGMIGHHAQALVMAGLVADRTRTPALNTLAGRILNGQRDEIRLMQQWLRERGLTAPEPDASGAMPMHDHGGHGGMMPGMLSPAQMDSLRAARGGVFDRLFLHYMIQHHNGAIVMVDSLIASPGAAQDETVFKMMAGVRVDQTTEIDRMRMMLITLP